MKITAVVCVVLLLRCKQTPDDIAMSGRVHCIKSAVCCLKLSAMKILLIP